MPDRKCQFCGCVTLGALRCCCDKGKAEDRLITGVKNVMLAEVRRVGHDDALPMRLQPEMIEPAMEWLRPIGQGTRPDEKRERRDDRFHVKGVNPMASQSVFSWQVWRLAWMPRWDSGVTTYRFGDQATWKRVLFGFCWLEQPKV